MQPLNKDAQNETLMWPFSVKLILLALNSTQTSFCTVKVKHSTVEQEEKCFLSGEQLKQNITESLGRISSLSLSAETWLSSAVAVAHTSMQTLQSVQSACSDPVVLVLGKVPAVMVPTDVVPKT